uniref:Peptidase C1A papain C-terminal domain-containing protein n=1 Tax=Lactuca sativa TaxID=4236 RepID=A0A9R1WJJ0_LACSA|nr:hypothetical protein LSAT_V11C100046970 [Lactuca sativa]
MVALRKTVTVRSFLLLQFEYLELNSILISKSLITGNHSENGTLKEQIPIKTPQKQNGGCDGGEMEDGFEFIVKNKGINTEVAYPYQATDGTCNTKEEAVHAATITGYEKVPANSESALLQAVANQPVSVAIDASGMGFQFYSGGVFTGDFGTDLDHGVTSLLNQMELYVVVYILAILGLDSLQGIMLDQGSCIDTCCTFCRKFLKLSPEESSKDPLYLLRDMDAMGYKRGHFVLIAKIIISALGYLMLGTFIYVLIVDGSTFNANVLSRCMIATTTDFYFCIVIVAVWIAYKESRWISAFFWILSLLSFWRVLFKYTMPWCYSIYIIIISSFTDNIYHLYAGILVIVFVIVDIKSQELSEQGFNISLKEV